MTEPRRNIHGGIVGGALGLGILAVLVILCGCSPSAFLARKMTEAPNAAPEYLKPDGRVLLRLPAGVLDHFASGTHSVGTPPAPVRWVLVEPDDYGLEVASKTWRKRGKVRGEFTLKATLPKRTPTAEADAADVPRALGTAFLIHGYGMDLETMFPWALYLAEAGWRSVLVDLRGHGLSGGSRVYFGARETNDLCILRRELEIEGRVQGPYVAVGHSLGAAIALRWQVVDPDIAASVAFGALSEFEPAAERLRREYVPWIPSGWVRRAVRRLPGVLDLPDGSLDTVEALRTRPVRGYLVAGAGDAVTPPEDSAALRPWLAQGSEFLIVEKVTHETLPYVFEQHGARIRRWLEAVAAEGWAKQETGSGEVRTDAEPGGQRRSGEAGVEETESPGGG